MHSKRENSAPKTEGKMDVEEIRGQRLTDKVTGYVCVEFVGEEAPGLIVKGYLCVGEIVA